MVELWMEWSFSIEMVEALKGVHQLYLQETILGFLAKKMLHPQGQRSIVFLGIENPRTRILISHLGNEWLDLFSGLVPGLTLYK